MKKWLSIGLAASAGALTLSAQTIEEAAKEVRWSLDEQGRVCIYPDPVSGGASETPQPALDLGRSMIWSNLGLLGNLAVALSGNADMVSLTDAVRFCERLGIDQEELVSRLGQGCPDDEIGKLQFIVMIRAAQDLGIKPALGPLSKLANDVSVPPEVRRAAIDAMQWLRGKVEPQVPQLPPLTSILAEAPTGSIVTLVVDHATLPASRPLSMMARAAGLAVTKDEIRQAGGTVSAPMWAGALTIAEGTGLLGYEIARRFGNHRIHRTVAAIGIDAASGMDPAVRISWEGSFDLDRLAAGLKTTQGDWRREGDTVIVDPSSQLTLRVTENRAVLMTKNLGDKTLGAAGATRVAAALDVVSGHPIRAVFGELPEEMGATAIVTQFMPEVLGLSLSYRKGTPCSISARFASEDLAGAIAGQLAGLGRMAELAVDQGEAPEDILDWTDEMTVKQDGARVEIRIPALYMEAARIEKLVESMGR